VRTIQVVPYDPEWPTVFLRLREQIWPAVCEVAIAFEHVGSTAVPGLAAKPVIDADLVIPSRDELPETITRLRTLCYEPLGDLGIADREAFREPAGTPRHNLYVCPEGSLALRNHLALRDHLRSHPEGVEAYGALKMGLATKFGHDIDGYVEGKSEFILSILSQHGFAAGELASVQEVNRRGGPKETFLPDA